MKSAKKELNIQREIFENEDQKTTLYIVKLDGASGNYTNLSTLTQDFFWKFNRHRGKMEIFYATDATEEIAFRDDVMSKASGFVIDTLGLTIYEIENHADIEIPTGDSPFWLIPGKRTGEKYVVP